MSVKSPVEIEAVGERKEITPSAATPCSACPHCGGTSGYYYKNTIYGTQWMEWNGEPVSFDDHSSKHGIKRCMDCKKRITPNVELSHGGEEKHG